MTEQATALEQLDALLDQVELVIHELPLSATNQSRCVDMLYTMYEIAEAAELEVDTVAD